MSGEHWEFIVLGSGTSTPHPRRAPSGFWLQTAAGSLLLDCGAPTAHRVAQERLDWAQLDAVWISHFHLDHVGGLAPLLFGTKYAAQTHARRKPLTVFGPRGISELLRALDQANDYRLREQPFPLEVREVEPGVDFAVLAGVNARALDTPHTAESLALKLTSEADPSLSLVYTSDTGQADELADFARDATLLVIECSFWRRTLVPIHLDLEGAMRVAREAAPGRALLTHFYDEWDGVDVAAEAKKLWAGETVEARDGLRLRIEGRASSSP